MKCIKLMIAVLGLSLLTANSYASETGYEVELIIYEDTTKRYIDSEEWSYNDMLNQSNTAAMDTDAPEPDSQFSELDWDGATLSGVLQKIEDNPGFNVLITKRWRQTGLDRDKAYSVEINAQIPQITDPTSADYKPANDSGLNPPNSETGSVEVMPLPTTTINGYVRLVMSRYLHFEVNLNYSRIMPDDNLGSYINNIFPVVAERRMRSREIHYIDHPLVGIIVHTTPYKIGSNKDVE
jgi:hypothetical protein